MKNDFPSLSKALKILICVVVLIGACVLVIIALTIYRNLTMGIVTVDAFLGTSAALIGVFATIIVANHFISIYNFNNKIANIERKLENIENIEKKLIYTQYEVNKTLAYNSFLEKKMLKAMKYELDNMLFLIKNDVYFNESNEGIRKKLNSRIGYLVNDFLCFFERGLYKKPKINLDHAFLEITERIQQLEKDDLYGIRIRMNIIKKILVKAQRNIRNNKTRPITKNDKRQLNALRKG